MCGIFFNHQTARAFQSALTLKSQRRFLFRMVLKIWQINSKGNFEYLQAHKHARLVLAKFFLNVFTLFRLKEKIL